jgi:hypothetical protein
MGLLDEPDDLQLLCGRISHSPSRHRSAKAAGKHCGRPFIDTKLWHALAAPGRASLHKIAKQFGVGTGTVQRIAEVG